MNKLTYSILLTLFIFWFNCNRPMPMELQNRPPFTPKNLFPYDDTTNVEIDIAFRWEGGDPDNAENITYDLYLDIKNTNLKLHSSKLDSNVFHIKSLEYNTKYYWRIIACDDQGAVTESPVWEFITIPGNNNAPNVPNYPVPELNKSDVILDNLELSWQGGDPDNFNNVTYNIYFGSTSDSLMVATSPRYNTSPSSLALNTR